MEYDSTAKRELFSLTSRDFRFPFHADVNHFPITKMGDNIPLIFYPDGHWCFEANSYILSQYDKNLSRKSAGGTLATYASYLSHFIRFCYFNRIRFHEITDNEFNLFMVSLSGERRKNNPEVFCRSANTVITIGRQVLNFLFHVAKLHGIDNFVGENGIIRVTKKNSTREYINRKGGQRYIFSETYIHRSFPQPSPLKKRLPISNQTIEAMQAAIQTTTKDSFIKKRRYLLLLMLEVTGGRRGEIAEMKVSDIYDAYKMQSPHLKLHTLKKKKSDSIRYIPISKNDLKVAIEFIEKNRSIVIDNTVGSNGDQGYLFISKTQGARLKDNTITQELSLIAKSACIKVQACPHLFRHRFITKMFISLIEHHKILNAESFLSNELDIQMLQTKAIEASGHASMSSLTPYLHIAYAEVRKISKTFDESMRSNFVSSAISGLKICKDMLEHGTQPVELIERIEVLVNHLLDDNNWSSPHNPQTF